MREENVNWQRLARHFASKTTLEEEQDLERWIKADPSRRLWVEQLRRIWKLSKTSEDKQSFSSDTDADWERLSDHIQSDPPSSKRKEKLKETSRHSRLGDRPAVERMSRSKARARRRQRPWLKRMAIGGAACLVLAGAVFLMSHLKKTSGLAATTAMREVTTKPGERARVQMADGTKITLNVDSRISLPNSSRDTVRQVYLHGEAYFDVASSKRPFVVHAGDAVVKVHGTVFGVRSYQEDRQVQVAVEKGSVSLHPDQKGASGVQLTRGQLGRVAGKNQLITTREVDVSKYLGWVNGQIVFDDTPLPVVAKRLSRWYDLGFEIKDSSLRKLHLTARLKSTSIRNVMDVIAATLNLRYEIRDSQVILEAGPPQNSTLDRMHTPRKGSSSQKAKSNQPAEKAVHDSGNASRYPGAGDYLSITDGML